MPTSLTALKVLIVANAPAFPSWMPTSLTDFETKIKSIISAAFDITGHTWTEVTGLIPTWSDLLPYGYPSTLINLKAKIKSTLLGSFSSIDTWFDSKKDSISTWVKDLFPYDFTDAEAFLTWLGLTAGDVIYTILDTPAKMWDWMKDEVPKTYDIVGHKWSEVTGLIPTWSDIIPTEFPSSLSDLISIIKTNAPGFPVWMPTSLPDFKDKIVSYVSDSFESILDYVFKKEG